MGYLINARSSTVAMLINYFNTASIIAVAILALLGVIAIFSKKLRVRAPALSAFGAAALTAFALEATAFNFLHYLKYFAGPRTGITGVSKTDPKTLLTTDGARAELVKEGIRFSNLNRKAASVFVDIDFKNLETAEMLVKWTDEGMTQEYVKTLYKHLPHDNYAPLQPCGKVSELTILFNGDIEINGVEINKPIPFYFSGLRLLVVSLLVFAVFALAYKKLRAKTSYYLFEYKFDPKNKKQNAVYACTVALLILFSGICVYTSVPEKSMGTPSTSQYGKHLVDALIAGRTYLDYGNPEKLLAAERPYDNQYRQANGYDEVFDWAWYKGKYYCYFGAVPAVLLFVPYKLITGNYLMDYTGTFLFSALAVILLALLWRHCVKKYMRDMRYALYLLSFPTLFFAGGISIALRFPHFYSVVQCAGFMFSIAGILLLLKSVDSEKIDRLKLFFACLCLALVFGCRPNMGLASLLVPVILWKRRSWKLCAFALLPYVLVAIPLCVYNYARFESIFDFGASYNLTYYDMTAYAQQNLLSKFFRVFVCSAYYLFCPNRFYLYFPFVNLTTSQPVNHVSLGIMWHFNNVCGIINFPIVFCLLYLFKNVFDKNRPNTFYALSASLVIALAIIVLNSMVVGVTARYWFDFGTLMIFPSLFCAYYWCRNVVGQSSGMVGTDRLKNRLSLTYVLIAVSIYVGLFVSVRTIFSYYNPTLYRYLEYSLGVFRDV